MRGFKKIFQEIAQTKTFTKFRKLMSYKTKATSGGGLEVQTGRTGERGLPPRPPDRRSFGWMNMFGSPTD